MRSNHYYTICEPEIEDLLTGYDYESYTEEDYISEEMMNRIYIEVYESG